MYQFYKIGNHIRCTAKRACNQTSVLSPGNYFLSEAECYFQVVVFSSRANLRDHVTDAKAQFFTVGELVLALSVWP